MSLEVGSVGAIRPVQLRQAKLEVAVIYTRLRETLAALRQAALLARDLNAVLHLVVPQVVPFPLPLNDPATSQAFTERRFRVLLAGISVETRVDVQLCREPEWGLSHALPERSLVVLGVSRRGWWARERRWARRLRKQGHSVVEVSCARKAS